MDNCPNILQDMWMLFHTNSGCCKANCHKLRLRQLLLVELIAKVYACLLVDLLMRLFHSALLQHWKFFAWGRIVCADHSEIWTIFCSSVLRKDFLWCISFPDRLISPWSCSIFYKPSTSAVFAIEVSACVNVCDLLSRHCSCLSREVPYNIGHLVVSCMFWGVFCRPIKLLDAIILVLFSMKQIQSASDGWVCLKFRRCVCYCCRDGCCKREVCGLLNIFHSSCLMLNEVQKKSILVFAKLVIGADDGPWYNLIGGIAWNCLDP